MTFPTHGLSGGVLHALIGKFLLWIIALLVGIIGLSVPVWFSAVVLYLFFTSGIYLGAFPDTEDWLQAEITGTSPRWTLYTACHSGWLYKRYRWIPAWWWHVFCDRFAHPPIAGQPLKWYQMNPAWRDKALLFGVSWWDVQYAMRELAVLVLTAIAAWFWGLI
jgi:hypothetical protein